MTADEVFSCREVSEARQFSSSVRDVEAWSECSTTSAVEAFNQSLQHGLWLAPRPVRYEAKEWSEVMLMEGNKWPCGAPDMCLVIGLQGLARSVHLITSASSRCTEFASQHQVKDWMLQVLEEKFDFASSTIAFFVQHLADNIMSKVKAPGVAVPQSLLTFQVELQAKSEHSRAKISEANMALQGYRRSTARLVENMHRSLMSYRRTVLMLCKVALEDWVFLLRKHMSPAQLGWEEVQLYQKVLSESSMKSANKFVGLLLSPLLDLPRQSAVATLKRGGLSGIASRIMVVWVLRVHKIKFEKQLNLVIEGNRPRPAWKFSLD
mmetsp:Transcript_16177/g.38351  ORF Transcript_16177/g.38351 Transcript_16177/m.38351 type:complete len:322 (+) Transcript_16177:350-1315(+)